MKEQENQKEALVAECYARYRELLVAFAHKRTRDWEDAEDIVQDAFVRMWNMENMICVSTVRSLAFTIVQNLLVDRLRGRLKRAEAQTYLFESQPAYVEDACWFVICFVWKAKEQVRFRRLAVRFIE